MEFFWTHDSGSRQLGLDPLTKRVRAARAMMTAMRVVGDKEGEGGKGHGVGNKCGMQ